VRSLLLGRAAAPVLALTVLAALLRFWRIGHQGFWFDEANTALLVHFSPGKMLGLIPQSESTPPLYYCVAWVWARVFGYTEAPLRSLSAVLGVALVPVAYAAGAKLVGRPAGLIAGALTACSPLLIWYSQEARSYAMLALLSGASLLAFTSARERPTPRRLAAWVACSALALATHYYAVLLVAPEALWLLWVERRRRPVQTAVAVVGLCGLGLLALALTQSSTGRALWIAHAPLGRRLGQLVPQFVVSFQGPARGVLEPLAIALVVLGLGLLATRSEPEPRRGALLAGGLALSGFALGLVLIGFGFDDVLTRNLLALWLPAALLVAGGLAAARARRIGLAATIALCLIGVATAAGVAVDRDYQRPDWRVVARVLGSSPRTGTRAIFIQHYRDLLPLSLYLPGLEAAARRAATVSELDIVSFRSPPSAGFCWWGSACNLWPSVMQAGYRIPGFHEAWRRHALQFTILRLVASPPVRLTARQLRPVLQTTALSTDELLFQRSRR
jgi:4-amino-4-deoxy-L-arabinose transferase-like glycosyltransferase